VKTFVYKEDIVLISGSQSSGYEQFYLLGYVFQSTEIQQLTTPHYIPEAGTL
jgi:hypothetical protein